MLGRGARAAIGPHMGREPGACFLRIPQTADQFGLGGSFDNCTAQTAGHITAIKAIDTVSVHILRHQICRYMLTDRAGALM